MRQRHVTHPPGTFAACASCRREPMHIECIGRTAREGVASAAAVAPRHQLECCRCDRTTARHSTLDAARAEWTSFFAQAPGLRVVNPRPVAHNPTQGTQA